LASILGLGASVVWSCASGENPESSAAGDDDGEGLSGGTGGDGPGAAGGSGSSGGSGSGGATSCAETPCKIVPPQCGCAADEQCSVGDPTADNPNGRFCDVAGDTPVGEACNNGVKCVEGAMCVNAGGLSTCLEFCANDTNCDAPGGVCLITLEDGTATIPDATLCSTNCDPASNVGCDVAGSGCVIGKDPTSAKTFSICVGTGAGTQGVTCTSNASCAPTFGCFTVGTEQKCLKYCGYSPLGAACPLDTVCTPFTEQLVLGMQEYGACQ
jgi:hypothetical protein